MFRVLEKPPKKITSAQMEPPSLERKLRGIYILSTLSKFCATAISMMQLDIFGQRLQPHHSGNSHLNVYLFLCPPPQKKKNDIFVNIPFSISHLQVWYFVLDDLTQKILSKETRNVKGLLATVLLERALSYIGFCD